MEKLEPLKPASLYHPCDPGELSFETTLELEELQEVIGQPRAIEAVKFGIGIRQQGYNLFALGPAGTGKHSILQQYFQEQAADEPIAQDLCYVHNFEQPHRPHAIQLPPGMGSRFRQDMAELVEGLRNAITAAFESDEYRARRQVIEEEIQEHQERSLEAIQAKAQERSLIVMRTPSGILFAPVRDGEVLKPDDFKQLPAEERKRVQAVIEELQGELQKTLEQIPHLQRQLQERVQELNREITGVAVGGLIEELRRKYEENPAVVSQLDGVEQDVVENAGSFLEEDENRFGELAALLGSSVGRGRSAAPLLRRYQVNLLVDHSKSQGAPVIYEDNPTIENLLGRVEHIAQMGALVTDFQLIKAGALHRANGGYLLLDARKVLMQPYAWEALKRTLESRQIRIESVGQMLSIVTTVSLEPEPVPLDLKIALLGDRQLYYLLSSLDPDFKELFKVAADFDEQMERTTEGQNQYAQLIATLARKYDLRPLHRNAVARVIEHSARMIGDSQKLSARMMEVADVIREADYFAGKAARSVIQAEDVQSAIESRIYRHDRLRQRLQEEVLRGTILIDTEGAAIGQINGLSVLQLGDFAFGHPSRITARVRIGKGDVVNIEREVELSGPIHSKGVLILSGFLGARYAQERPLSLSASLVFEQSYSGVEGDSASSAELYALLSAIAEVPIQQSLAVTGSVNQHGQVQAIGGVNEKIEGFFDLCKLRGLTGEQGVLIPASNVKHLMLRQDVIDAVAKGMFIIYPIETIDQGIEILTGYPAGERGEDGLYPEGSINGRVQVRLDQLADAMAARGKDR